ncbi:MAG: hypothetical protein OSB10_04540, partial [Planctomycetota bacterium]|nr:hypothetical protein [Planctomycetota bacterium]
LLFGAASVATLWGLGALGAAWGHDYGSHTQAYANYGLGHLLLLGLVGRVLLSWLPPGFPGEHGLARRDSGGLLATWATSHLLGVAAFAACFSLQGFVGAQLGIGESVIEWVVGLGLLTLLVISVETGPAAMVPRHGMPGIERPGIVAKALLVALLLVGVAPLVLTLVDAMRLLIIPGLGAGPMAPFFSVFRGSPGSTPTSLFAAPLLSPATSAAAFAATLVLFSHALAAARLGPVVRRFAVLLFALLPAGIAEVSSSAPEGMLATTPLLAMLLTGGTAFGYTSLLRADRRAATLSIIAFAAMPFLAPANLAGSTTGMALAGLLSLLILTPRTGRARIAKPLFAALVLTIAAGILRFPYEQFGPLAETPADEIGPLYTIFTAALAGYKVEAFGILFGLVDATALALILRRPWRNGGGPAGANLPRPELAFVFMVALLAWLIPMGIELVIEGYFPGARNLWSSSIGQALVLIAGPGALMVATGIPALFPATVQSEETN